MQQGVHLIRTGKLFDIDASADSQFGATSLQLWSAPGKDAALAAPTLS
ncbi:MAG: hypothetical protein ABI972_27915 [Acidobacteriota bacterium]